MCQFVSRYVVFLTIMFHFCHMNFSVRYECFGISSVKSSIKKIFTKNDRNGTGFALYKDTEILSPIEGEMT